MKEFYQDVKDRKAMASGSRHKRNGSKTKFVSLPHDNMTLGAWKKMNGEVITYDLKSPLTWKQFKDLPNDLKGQYLLNLQAEYNATSSSIAHCFGIQPSYFYKYLSTNKIQVSFPKGRSNKVDTRRLNRFFGIADDDDHKSEIETITTDHAEQFERSAVVLPVAASESTNIDAKRMAMPKFTLRFEGPFEPESIAHSLKFMINEGEMVVVDIAVTKEG